MPRDRQYIPEVWHAHASTRADNTLVQLANVQCPKYTRKVILSQTDIDAVPLVVAQLSAAENVRALMRGLLQLAPADRMTCDAAMDHIFCERDGADRIRGRR